MIALPTLRCLQILLNHESRRVGLGTTVEYIERKFKTRPRSTMSWKTLETSRLEPAAPNRLADQKRCALSTQPNPHLPINHYYLATSNSATVLCLSTLVLLVKPMHTYGWNVCAGITCHLNHNGCRRVRRPRTLALASLLSSVSSLQNSRDFSSPRKDLVLGRDGGI